MGARVGRVWVSAGGQRHPQVDIRLLQDTLLSFLYTPIFSIVQNWRNSNVNWSRGMNEIGDVQGRAGSTTLCNGIGKRYLCCRSKWGMPMTGTNGFAIVQTLGPPSCPFPPVCNFTSSNEVKRYRRQERGGGEAHHQQSQHDPDNL